MYNYITGSCVKAKVFPAHLNLPNIPYENNMSDKASPMFKETADRITQELDEIFSSDPTYVRSIVLKLWSAVNSQLREAQGTNTSIEIIFSAVSNITTRHILYELGTAIATSCNTCTLKGAAVVDEKLCDRDPCEELTTTCSSNDGNFTCTCKEGHIPTDSLRRCHVCPSGQKAGDSECINCPFGYSGFNCNESWQLILVIIGSVFTALLLIAIILLPLLIRKFSKKKSKTDTSSKTSLINGHSLNSHASVFDKGSATGLAVFTKNGVLRLPRATVNSSWNSTTRLEMTASNS
ncbi:mucin-13-like [Mugil cephalus]|uniref:mucin-13-like n=1 Tax=Mugil cephalus TaxID=48193 RepID=UPI001FB69A55|nr:mucin-13-like [Mugil cephalus]